MKKVWIYIVTAVIAISLIIGGITIANINNNTTQTTVSVDEINSELTGLQKIDNNITELNTSIIKYKDNIIEESMPKEESIQEIIDKALEIAQKLNATGIDVDKIKDLSEDIDEMIKDDVAKQDKMIELATELSNELAASQKVLEDLINEKTTYLETALKNHDDKISDAKKI